MSKTATHPAKFYEAFLKQLIKAWQDIAFEATRLPEAERTRFEDWLKWFKVQYWPHIFALMRHFRYYTAEDTIQLLDKCLNQLENGSVDPKNRYLFSILGRINKSSAAILPLVFKTKWANCHKDFLKTVDPAILHERLSLELLCSADNRPEHLHLVLVDDFIGSGGQLKSYLKTILEDLFVYFKQKDIKIGNISQKLKEKLTIHIIYAIGINSKPFRKDKEIKYKTDNYTVTLNEKDEKNQNYKGINIHLYIGDITKPVPYFSGPIKDNKRFVLPDIKKETIETLNLFKNIADGREKEHPLLFEPFGWKDCGGVVANYANTPGNTLPIIWGGGYKDGLRKPLFPRYFNPFDDGGVSLERFFKCLLSEKKIKILCGHPKYIAFLLVRFVKTKALDDWEKELPVELKGKKDAIDCWIKKFKDDNKERDEFETHSLNSQTNDQITISMKAFIKSLPE